METHFTGGHLETDESSKAAKPMLEVLDLVRDMREEQERCDKEFEERLQADQGSLLKFVKKDYMVIA